MSDLNESERMIMDNMDRCAGLLDEAEELATRKKEWKAECKGTGLDPALIEKTVKLKRADQDKVAENEAIFDTYKRVAGIA